MTTSEQKKILREQLRQQRELLTKIEVKHASSEVSERLKAFLGVPRGKRMHVYAAKELWNEINTAVFTEWIKEQDSSVSIEVAVHAPVQEIPTEQYDIVLVPMLAFDNTLHRLGMGMGWYDMFLAKQRHALKIGIAYDWAELDSLVTEEHDISMDVIVTPSRIIHA